jgi:phenylpyruvate tautomerase PptA (4-oxalocrotonate tautomerase family)
MVLVHGVPETAAIWDRIRPHLTITHAHTGVTGEPAHIVDTAFVEVAAGSLSVADRPTEHGVMVGLIRRERDEATLRRLVHALAVAWRTTTGEARDQLAIFVNEVPDHALMETHRFTS